MRLFPTIILTALLFALSSGVALGACNSTDTLDRELDRGTLLVQTANSNILLVCRNSATSRTTLPASTRAYNPSTGRFGATDPIEHSVGLPYSNTYQYGLNNPLVYTDPSGMSVYDWRSLMQAVRNHGREAVVSTADEATQSVLGYEASESCKKPKPRSDAQQVSQSQPRFDLPDKGLDFGAAVGYSPGYYAYWAARGRDYGPVGNNLLLMVQLASLGGADPTIDWLQNDPRGIMDDHRWGTTDVHHAANDYPAPGDPHSVFLPGLGEGGIDLAYGGRTTRNVPACAEPVSVLH